MRSTSVALFGLLAVTAAGCPSSSRTPYPAPLPRQVAATAPLTSTTWVVAFAPGFSSRLFRADAPDGSFAVLLPPGDEVVGISVDPAPARGAVLHVAAVGSEVVISRTEDRGATWMRASTGLPSSTTGGSPLTIHADGRLADRVWLGLDAESPTGRPALFRSLDRGQTWTALAYPGTSAAAVTVDSTDASRVRVMAPDAVYLSTDGGQSFTRDVTGLRAPPYLVDLKADGRVAGRAWCLSAGGLYRADLGNGGWVELPAARTVRGPDGLAATPTRIAVFGDRVLLGVQRHGLFVSEDAGRTFVFPSGGLPSTLDFDLTPAGILIDETLPTRVLLVTRIGLFQSDDGGRTWRPLPGTGLPLLR